MQAQTVSSFVISVTKPFRIYIMGLAFVALVWALLLNIQPYIVKLILNETVLNDEALFHRIGRLMIAYLFSELIYLSIFRLYDWLTIKLRPTLKKHIGLALMDRMMEHSHSFYQHQFAGSLTTRINDIVVGIPDVIKIVTERLLACSLMLLFVLYNLSL